MLSPFIHLESTVGERCDKRKSDDLMERDLQEKSVLKVTEKEC
jgi:hypothetical protein